MFLSGSYSPRKPNSEIWYCDFFCGQPTFMPMRSSSRIITILLLTGMMTQINYVATCYLLFSLNRKAIAEKLCEKKTRNCCGKCFLNKKIAAVEEKPVSRSENSSANTPSYPKTQKPVEAISPSPVHSVLLPAVRTGSNTTFCCFPIDGYYRLVYIPPEIIPYTRA